MKLMGRKIKNLFFNFIWTKKRLILAVFFFVFLGLALPLQLVQAQGFLGALASLPMNLFTTLVLQPILFVSNIICALARMILGWVVGPYFTTLPYTHGGIVEIGWPIVRDFINMFFIIALVIIGLATALRIKEYQAQKSLPILIIIAVLINFTPVICGLIIDASNIIMNFFLERLTGFAAIGESFEMQGSIVAELWRTPGHFFDIRYAASALGQSLVMIIFDWVAAYIFFIFALLFIMRYVMIWALVIVSPIAFFSKIFKGSEKYLFKSILGWDEWWKQFIEWSLLGVVAGFFLYLAEVLMTIAPGMISGLPPGQGTSSWVDNPLVDFVNNFLPWMVVLVFLWLGYKIAKSTSAMGAQGAIKAVDTGIKIAATAAITAATLGAGAGLAAKGLGGMARGAQRMEAAATKLPGGKVWTKPFTKPISWATRGMERVAVSPLVKYAEKTREVKIPEGFEKWTPEHQAQVAGSQLTKGSRVKFAAKMAELGTLGKTSPEFREKMASEAESLSKKPEFKKSAEGIADVLPDKVTRTFKINLEPTLEDKKKMEDKINEEVKDIKAKISVDVSLKNKIEKQATKKGISAERHIEDVAAGTIHTRGLKPGDIPKVAKSSLDTVQFRLGTQGMTSQHLQRIQGEWGKEELDKVLNEPGGLNTMFVGKTDEENRKILEEFYLRNPRMVHFFSETPAGREMAWEGKKYIKDFGAFIKEMEPKVEARRKREEERKRKEEEEKERAEKEKIAEEKGPRGRRGVSETKEAIKKVTKGPRGRRGV